MSKQDIEQSRPAVSVAEFHALFHKIRAELGKVVVGQEQVILHILCAVFAGGHVLLKGSPGLGRTLIVQTLADVLGFKFGRIQFTPDLLPTDITGTEVLEHDVATGDRHFRFFEGPVFANLVLADEINRAPARTQAALLEVMQERQITVGGQTHFLPRPFMLIATENTVDHEGVFPLGEAQVDRFLMMIEQAYPSGGEEKDMLVRTTGLVKPTVEAVANPELVMAMQTLARHVPVTPSVKDFAVHLVRASRPGEVDSDAATSGIRLGASPRASQALIVLAKVMALAKGRRHVTRQDIVAVAEPVLAHRLLLGFRAQAQGKTYRDILPLLVRAASERHLPDVSRWIRHVLTTPRHFGVGEAAVANGGGRSQAE
jgi:MoxR-like ATPase